MIDRVSYERWTRIKDYPDYLVSTFGRVKSFRNPRTNLNGGQIIKGVDRKGYRRVELYSNNGRKTINIHRLVAMTFIPNPDNKETINHIDGNKINNRVDNLEWNTRQENFNHANDNGLHPKPRIAVLQFTMDGNFVGEFESISEASRQTGVGMGNIANACYEDRYSAGGFVWKHKNN